MVKSQPRTNKETHTLILRKEQEKRYEKKKSVATTYYLALAIKNPVFSVG